MIKLKTNSWRLHRLSLLMAVLLAVLAGLYPLNVGQAHAALVRSDPADNSILPESPAEVRMWFSETIVADFSSAKMLDLNGNAVQGITIHVDPQDPTLLVLKLPHLNPGVYSINWRVLSVVDGHYNQGLMVFGVGNQAELGAGLTGTQNPTGAPLIEVFLRGINYISVSLLAGAILMILTILSLTTTDPQLSALRAAARRRVLVFLRWGTYLALLIGLCWLAWQASQSIDSMASPRVILSTIWQLVFQTRWGALWWARQGLVSGILVSVLFALRSSKTLSRAALWIGMVLSVALLVVQALGSHAATILPNPVLTILGDAFHLLAASLWVGGISGMVVGLVPVLLRMDRANFSLLARESWGPFSRVAAISVGALFSTGLFSMAYQVASLNALFQSVYGQILLQKLGVFILIGLIGLSNSVILHPQLAAPLARLLGKPRGWTPLPLRALPFLVGLEATLGIAVFMIVGLLTTNPPANGPEYRYAGLTQPEFVTQNVDDLLVIFSARPNKPGQNIFNVRAVSLRKPARAEIMRVIVRFKYLDQDLGRQMVDAVLIEPGLYRVGGSYLSLPGPWQVDVVVRQKGVPDSVATFQWNVPPLAAADNVQIASNGSLKPIFRPVAGGLFATVLLLGGVWFTLRKKRWA